jgi:hypothetical protein
MIAQIRSMAPDSFKSSGLTPDYIFKKNNYQLERSRLRRLWAKRNRYIEPVSFQQYLDPAAAALFLKAGNQREQSHRQI